MSVERRTGSDRRHDGDSTDRLDRIEGKLDKMSEAIVSLARMEERMITLFKRMDKYDEEQTSIERRVATVETAQATHNGSSTWVDKIVMILVAGALTAAFFASR
jgi:hypothetical protein